VNPDKIKAWAGALIAIGGVCALSFWGVPYYIGTQVRMHVTDELKQQAVTEAVDAVEDLATTNRATLNAINEQLGRMEAAQIRRDELFAAYLERQAARAGQ